MKKHSFISVMGTMGSGKTTAAHYIAEHFKFRLIEENFAENAFLARFYADMKRWAFHSQIFFLMEKIKQSQIISGLLSHTDVVQDTPIFQDVFSYSKAQQVLGNMDAVEWQLYRNIYSQFEDLLPKPDYIVYLSASIPNLLKRINKRARRYEKTVDDSYLTLLDKFNRDWINENKAIPVIQVDTDGLNIVRDKEARHIFLQYVNDKL